MEKFIEYQQNAESRFYKYEEERRKSDREHEERMMAMISMMCQTQMPPPSQMHMYYPRAPPHYPYQQGTGNSATHNIPPSLRYPYLLVQSRWTTFQHLMPTPMKTVDIMHSVIV